MPYTLSKAIVIKEDVAEALDYYDAISESLALRFEKELKEAFDKIEQQPYCYFKISSQYRRIVLPSFPYMIVYRIVEKTVIIIAVFHQKKHPKKLKSRY